jgi:hypothetical protein
LAFPLVRINSNFLQNPDGPEIRSVPILCPFCARVVPKKLGEFLEYWFSDYCA